MDDLNRFEDHITYRLDENKEATNELKSTLQKLIDDYDKFNDKVMVKLTELDTKMKLWAVLGAAVISLSVAFLKDFLKG